MGFFNLTKVCGRLGNRKAKEFFEKVRVFREYYTSTGAIRLEWILEDDFSLDQ